MKTGAPDLTTIPKIKDRTDVVVRDGDIEAALRLLKRRMLTDGTLRLLAVRRSNPTGAGRKRIKAAKAWRHRLRYLQRKQTSDTKSPTR